MRYFQNSYTSVRKGNVETAIDHTGCLQKNLRPFQNNQTSFNFFPVSLLTIVTVGDTLEKIRVQNKPPKSFPQEITRAYLKTCKNQSEYN